MCDLEVLQGIEVSTQKAVSQGASSCGCASPGFLKLFLKFFVKLLLCALLHQVYLGTAPRLPEARCVLELMCTINPTSQDCKFGLAQVRACWRRFRGSQATDSGPRAHSKTQKAQPASNSLLKTRMGVRFCA